MFGLTFSNRPVQPDWAVSLLHLGLSLPINTTLGIACAREPDTESELPLGHIAEARTAIVRQALAADARYLMFIDDDTAPPNFAAQRLMSILDNNKQAAIAAGIYFTKSDNPVPVVGRKFGMGPSWDWKFGDVFEADVVGTGCMMVRTDVFKIIPEPWFLTVDKQGSGDWVIREKTTDDVYFCQKVLNAGYRIFADGGVIPVHWDVHTGKFYSLPSDSPPAQNVNQTPPEDGIDIALALQIPGWMSPAELKWLASMACLRKCIVEIGSYLGRSTRAIADNTSGIIYAVDDWRGPRDVDMPEEKRVSLERQFMVNMSGAGNVVPIFSDHGDSDIIYAIKASESIDMVFIDGSHDYDSVIRDISRWKSWVNSGTLMCGHDISWPDVKRAVSELIPDFKIAPGTDIWYAEL